MTLPAVVNKYQEKVTVTKVKKFYSTVSNALLFAVNDNGNIDTWNFPNSNAGTQNKANLEVFAANILTYMKILRDCGIEKQNCMLDVDYKFLNGSAWAAYSINRI